MKASSRFAVAIHVLAAMAFFKKAKGGVYDVFTAETIAWSVNTNPVVIRRILRQLQRANLVSSKPGPDGGSVLVQDPKKISLYQVLEAVEMDGVVQFHYREPNQQCPIGFHIQDSLRKHLVEPEQAFKDKLKEITVDHIAEEILERSNFNKYLNKGKTFSELRQEFAIHEGKLIKKL